MLPSSRRATQHLADCAEGEPRRPSGSACGPRGHAGSVVCVAAGDRSPRAESRNAPMRGNSIRTIIAPDGPGLDVVGVRPHQVAEAALVRDLLPPVDQPHLVDGAQLRREPAVHTQDAAVNDGGEGTPASAQNSAGTGTDVRGVRRAGHARAPVKQFRAVLPRVRIPVFALALVVKPVHLGDLAALVVAAEQRYAMRKSRFEKEKQCDGLHAVVSSVHKVALRPGRRE